jgi:hypothetical protein
MNQLQISTIKIIYNLLISNISISEKFDKINKLINTYSFKLFIHELFNYLLIIHDYKNINLLAIVELKILVANNNNINLLVIISKFL